MNIRYLVALPLLLPLVAWSQPAISNDDGASGYSSQPMTQDAFGNQTREWIDLQTSGRESSQAAPPLSGDVATHIYQRYVKSFDHPIPDHFSRENFVQGGGGGGSGSQ